MEKHSGKMKKTTVSGPTKGQKASASTETAVPKTKTAKKAKSNHSSGRGEKKPPTPRAEGGGAQGNQVKEVDARPGKEPEEWNETVELKDSKKSDTCVEKSVTLQVLIRRYRDLEPDFSRWPHDKQIDALNRLTHVRLDREQLTSMDGLELLGHNVTNLYLQHNRIAKMENLEGLSNLLFLTLSHNCITAIEGLHHLSKLGFLDLSENSINELDTAELPESIFLLQLDGNPCCKEDGFRQRVIGRLPRLITLDNVDVTQEERLEAGHDGPRIPGMIDDGSENDEDDDEDDEDDSKLSPVAVLEKELGVAQEDVGELNSTELMERLLDHYRELEESMETLLSSDYTILPSFNSILDRSHSRQEADQAEHESHMAESTQRLTELNLADIARSQSQMSEDSYQPIDEGKDKEDVQKLPSTSGVKKSRTK